MSAAEEKPQVDNVAVLPIAGARGRVEAVGIHGIFYKIRQGGVVLKKSRGGWPIAMKNGQESKLRSAGWLPGFQSLSVGEERIYSFGADVPLAAKILAFFPLIAIGWSPVVGVLLGVVFVFYSIVSIKNPLFPTKTRIALPIMNTIAAVLLTIVIVGGTTPS